MSPTYSAYSCTVFYGSRVNAPEKLIAVITLVYLVTHRVRLEMFGWLLHILIDIPTHSYRFFPTPFLWPISSYKISGISWADPRFMVINYSALAVAYLVLWLVRRNASSPTGVRPQQ